MINLICTSCKTDFNEENQPRLFPDCGHTFCSSCVSILIQNKTQVECPEDGLSNSHFSVEKGMESFPINCSLLKLMSKRQTSRKSPRRFRIELENYDKRDLCRDHNKTSDIVCLTDKTMICHKCALFGEHKTHEYKEIDDFKMLVQEKVKKVNSEVTRFDANDNKFESRAFVYSLKTKVEEKKSVFLNCVGKWFAEVEKAMHKKESEVRDKIQQTFSEFSEAFSYVSTNAKFLSDQRQELNYQLNKANEFLSIENLNIAFYLDNFYGELNLLDQFRRHQEDIKDFETTAKSIVDTQLGQIQMDTAIESVLEQISSAFEITKCNNESVSVQKNQTRKSTLKNKKITNQKMEIISLPDKKIEHKTNSQSSNSMSNVLKPLHKSSLQIETFETNFLELTKQCQSQRDIVSEASFKIEDGPKNISVILTPNEIEHKNPAKQIRNENQKEKKQQIVLESNLKSNKLTEKTQLTLANPIPKNVSHQSDLSQNRSINDDSANRSIELSSGEQLYQDKDHSHSSFNDCEEDVHFQEEPLEENTDRLFDNDPYYSPENSNNQKKIGSFLKKKKEEPTGKYANNQNHLNSSNSQLFEKIKSLEGPRHNQQINSSLQTNNHNVYSNSQKNNVVSMGSQRASGLQQNYNKRISQAQVPIQPMYSLDAHTNQKFFEENKHASQDDHSDSVPGLTQRKSFLVANPSSRLNMYQPGPQYSNTNLSDHFNPSKQIIRSRLDSDFEDVGPNNNFGNPKPNFSSKKPLNKNSLKDDFEVEMNFANKAINISKLPEILSLVCKNVKAKQLNLSNNYINEKGVELIVDKLFNHPTLEVISLSGNDIEEEVFQILAKRFKNNKKIRTILMKDNKRFKNFPSIRKHIAVLRKLNLKIEF